MRSTITIILSLILFQSTGQNLVPNPSFEDTISCPTNIGGQCLVRNWDIEYWVATTCASPDYFHECGPFLVSVPQNGFGGNAPARTGKGYMGVHLMTGGEYKEYISVTLLSPLVAGKSYEIKYFVKYPCNSPSPPCFYGSFTDDIGVYFSNGYPDTSGANGLFLLPLMPQVNQNQYGLLTDTLNWQPVIGVYTAIGGEDHITIGNFNPDSLTTNSYLYIDDVSLVETVVGINELFNHQRQLIRIVNLLGEDTEDTPNTLLIYVYDDGSTKKVFRIE